MASYFLDTSAVVKRYHAEAGTPVFDALFTEAGAERIVSLGTRRNGVGAAVEGPHGRD